MGTDVKASAESAASALSGAEIVRIVQGGNSVRTTVSAIATYFRGVINAFTKNQSVEFFDLTDGATVSVDSSLSNNFYLLIGGNRTLANPTNLTDGMILNFIIKQDGTGSRTLAYGSKYKFPGGAPTLTTAAGSIDFISGVYNAGLDLILCGIAQDIS